MEDFRSDPEEDQLKGKSNADDGTRVASFSESALGFLEVVSRRRRFVSWFVLSATVLTTIVALLLPKWYKSTSSVFPAEQTNLFPGLEGVSSLFRSLSPGRALSSLTGGSESDRYIAILKSERVADAVIAKFNLVSVYDYVGSSYPMEKTRKELAGNTEIELQNEGNLTVTVYDKEPAQAADMANYYVKLLNQTNSELQVQNARGNREFIEQRYNTNIADLRAAEDSMKQFQIQHGVLAVPEQAEATIKAGAELYARLATKEIELAAMKRTLSESHPSIATAEIEIQEYRRKLDEMNSGSSGGTGDVKILVPFKQAPELAAEYVRFYRNLQIQNKILEFLTPIYEQAKIEERRNTPSVVVLDIAAVPERKAKPKIALYSLLSFVLSSVASLFFVFVVEWVRRVRTINPDRFNALVHSLRSDWFGIRRERRNPRS